MRVEVVKYMLMAAEMERGVAFYRDVFGGRVKFQSDHWSELELAGSIFALHGGGSGARSPTGLSLQVDDIGAAVERIVAGGGRISEEPEHRPGEPILLGRFVDPEGNEVMLTQWVGAT